MNSIHLDFKSLGSTLRLEFNRMRYEGCKKTIENNRLSQFFGGGGGHASKVSNQQNVRRPQ